MALKILNIRGEETVVIDYYNSAGERIRAIIGTFAQLKAKVEAEHKAKSPTVRDAIIQYCEHTKTLILGKSNQDLPNLRRWAKTCGTKKLSEVSQVTISGYKQLREKSKKPRTIKGDLQSLRRFFEWCIAQGICTVNPAKSIKLPKAGQRERIIDTEEEARLLAVCGPELKLLVQVMLLTAMRRGEITALEWPDIDFARALIHIRHGKTTSSVRDVPMSQGLVALLRPLARPRGQVFELCRESYYKQFLRACGKAQLTDLTMHDLRHVAISRMIEAGADIKAVSQLVGHSDISMTLGIYNNPTDKIRRAAISKLDRQPMDTFGVDEKTRTA